MILSIETSTHICSVALHQKADLVDFTDLDKPNSHGEKLALLIKELLTKNRVNMEDLTGVAVASGPGSYTGLRIGLSTAKGICFALDLPLIAVDTLTALALRVENSKPQWLCPMIDARRMEVYCQLVDEKGGIRAPSEAKIIDHQSFDKYLTRHEILFFGNGAAKCKNTILHHNANFMDDVLPSARTVGILAWQKFLARDFENLAYFEPGYLKEYQTTVPKRTVL